MKHLLLILLSPTILFAQYHDHTLVERQVEALEEQNRLLNQMIAIETFKDSDERAERRDRQERERMETWAELRAERLAEERRATQQKDR